MNSGDLFEIIVNEHYEALYRFAMTLTRSECDAEDLTQQTFCIWAQKGHQLRDRTKVKTWLFTTLHRTFLAGQRRLVRFPHEQLDEAELPPVSPELGRRMDSAQVLAALGSVDEIYRAAVGLFYLEDCPYKEIAAILDVPVGTVKSRIARGITQLRQILFAAGGTGPTPNRDIQSAPEIPVIEGLSAPQESIPDWRRMLSSLRKSRTYAEWDLSSTLLPEPTGAI